MAWVASPAMLVSVIRQECGRYDYYWMDDLASDLATRFWAEEKEFECERHFRNYVRASARKSIHHGGIGIRRWMAFSELIGDTESEGLLDALCEPSLPKQEAIIDAGKIRKMALKWPHIHRAIVMILGDGGSLLDVSAELGVQPLVALKYLQECRQFVANGDSLIPLRRAA